MPTLDFLFSLDSLAIRDSRFEIREFVWLINVMIGSDEQQNGGDLLFSFFFFFSCFCTEYRVLHLLILMESN
jgi:hypothetical protein